MAVMQSVIRNQEKRVSENKKSSEAVRAQKFRNNIAILLGALFILGIFVVMQIALLESFTDEPGHKQLIGGDEQDPEDHSWLGPLMKERVRRLLKNNMAPSASNQAKAATLEVNGTSATAETIVRSISDTRSMQAVEKKADETGHDSFRKRAATAASGEFDEIQRGKDKVSEDSQAVLQKPQDLDPDKVIEKASSSEESAASSSKEPDREKDEAS